MNSLLICPKCKTVCGCELPLAYNLGVAQMYCSTCYELNRMNKCSTMKPGETVNLKAMKCIACNNKTDEYED